ncbi:MAG: DUF898 family protein, partial [Burkholderiales bacterium]
MDEDAGARAFEFHGSWREFAPIAFTNLLLTIVTLGVYSFWAKTRERQYLWANTRFIDDRLEWTGTGLELFIGYIIAFLVIVLPLGVMNFVMQAMAMQGHEGAAALLLMVIYIAVFYLVGVAVHPFAHALQLVRGRNLAAGFQTCGFGPTSQTHLASVAGH